MHQSSYPAFELPKQQGATGIDVLIVGAGIGGLWTALECWRQGHSVRILEKTAHPDSHGDFLTLNPAAVKAFRHWPQMEFEHQKAACHPLLSIYQHDGTCVQERKPITSGLVDGTGEPIQLVWRHLRPRLQQILLGQLARVGTTVDYGRCATSYGEIEDKGTVVLDDGTCLEADLVIAADGIGSKSQQLVLGHPVRARSSGSAVYRCAYPFESVKTDSLLYKHYEMSESESGLAEMWLGPALHCIVTRNRDTFSWAMTHQDNETSDESWSSASTPSEPLDALKAVQGAWENCPEMLKRVILHTPPNILVDFKIMWRDAQPTWTSPRGRVLQLGDAAHALVPSSGNGANQAIEDAVSIASCLHNGGKRDVPMAARIHNLLRFERVCCAQMAGFQSQASRENAGSGHRSKTSVAGVGSWIWRHDAEMYALENYEEAKRCLVSGLRFANTNIPPGYRYKPWDIDELLRMRDKGEGITLEGDWS